MYLYKCVRDHVSVFARTCQSVSCVHMNIFMSVYWGGIKPENLHPDGEILVRVLWRGSSKQMSHDVSLYFKKCQ